MYRRQEGELGGYFGKHTMMGEVENGLRGLEEILYGVSVVSGGVCYIMFEVWVLYYMRSALLFSFYICRLS